MRRTTNILMLMVTMGLTLVSFQNCTESFEYNPKNGALGSLSSSSGDFNFAIQREEVAQDEATLSSNTNYVVAFATQPQQTVNYDYDVVNNAALCVLSAGDVPLARTLRCGQVGQATLRVKATFPDGTLAIRARDIRIATAVTATPTPIPSATPMPTATPLNGALLYTNNCSGCHAGTAATSGKRGRTLTQLNNAIAGNTGGMGALSGLSTAQRQAIIDALNN